MAAKGQAQSGHPEKARSKHPSHCWLGPLQRPGAASGLLPGFLPPSILCDQGLAGALVPWEAKVTASPGSGQGLSAGPGWMTSRRSQGNSTPWQTRKSLNCSYPTTAGLGLFVFCMGGWDPTALTPRHSLARLISLSLRRGQSHQ